MLERNLTIEKLNIDDIVSPEGKYITHKGFYFSLGRGFRVKRINQKSISLAPVTYDGKQWIEEDIVRISKQAEEVVGFSAERKLVVPLFGRDNERI